MSLVNCLVFNAVMVFLWCHCEQIFNCTLRIKAFCQIYSFIILINETPHYPGNKTWILAEIKSDHCKNNYSNKTENIFSKYDITRSLTACFWLQIHNNEFIYIYPCELFNECEEWSCNNTKYEFLNVQP